MTADFNERERGFEKKFELDEELKFKVASRAAKMIGLWAAGQMGMQGDSASSYAHEVVVADLAQPDHEDLYTKLEADFMKYQIKVTRQQIIKAHESYLQEARGEIAG